MGQRLSTPAAARVPVTAACASAASAAAARRIKAAGMIVAAPPPAFWHTLFTVLPIDARLRCREVCRGWHAALSDASLWWRLDLSAVSGVAAARLENATLGLLEAAARRAGGQLQALDVTGCRRIDFALLRNVVASSAGALRDLRLGEGYSAEELGQLLRAAPQLRRLEAAALHVGVPELELMRDEQLFRPLRVSRLDIDGRDPTPFRFPLVPGPPRERPWEAPMQALAIRLAAAASPTELFISLIDLSTAGALEAVVDAALAHRVCTLSLSECRLYAAAAPALARLLDGGAVTTLLLGYSGPEAPWYNTAGAALLSDALRRNTALTSLQLCGLSLWHIPAGATALLGALTGHASLRELDINSNTADDTAAAASLGALVAADTLTRLNISHCGMGDVALGPLVDALPANTRLRTLICTDEDGIAYENNAMTEEFVRLRLLPAVRANTGLRELRLNAEYWESAVEAEQIVSDRTD